MSYQVAAPTFAMWKILPLPSRPSANGWMGGWADLSPRRPSARRRVGGSANSATPPSPFSSLHVALAKSTVYVGRPTWSFTTLVAVPALARPHMVRGNDGPCRPNSHWLRMITYRAPLAIRFRSPSSLEAPYTL